MKTIFAKYNSERLPKYQIVTKIVLDNDGQKYVIKEALCEEAKEHIVNIYNYYELLKKTHNLKLVKPMKIENGVMFEMAKGISLENILLNSIAYNDKKEFTKYIDKFLDLLNTMVIKRNVIFEPSEKFKTIFGEWESNKPQDIVNVANIDMIFGNIFVDEDDEFTFIDYEWVFDFEVPKSYILWRSLATFSSFHSLDLSKSMNNFDYIENDRFLKHDDMFSTFVRGEYKKYFLAPKVAKIVNFINFDKKEEVVNYDYFIQLFIENGNGLSEENSIKYSVVLNNKIQKFEFDLIKDKNNIKSLRLDPLNDYCVIKINEIRFNNIVYKDFINTNAIFKEDNLYYFNRDDSQIYINLPLNITIDVFSIEVQYLKIGKDTITDISNTFFKILNEKDQNIQELNQGLENRDENIQNLRNELNEKEQDIQEKLLDMEILKERIKLYYPDVHNEFFKGLK